MNDTPEGRVPATWSCSTARLGLIVTTRFTLLPAPIFRLTADLQSRRRLGLDRDGSARTAGRADACSLDRPEADDAP